VDCKIPKRPNNNNARMVCPARLNRTMAALLELAVGGFMEIPAAIAMPRAI